MGNFFKNCINVSILNFFENKIKRKGKGKRKRDFRWVISIFVLNEFEYFYINVELNKFVIVNI